MSDFSAQVTDLYSNNEFHTAGSLSTDGHMLIPALLILPPLSQIITHHHGKHSKRPHRNVRGRHHYKTTHTPLDMEIHGTMLFISNDEAAIPQSHELFTGFSHVLKHMYISTHIPMFPCFCEVIVSAFPPRIRIRKRGYEPQVDTLYEVLLELSLQAGK